MIHCTTNMSWYIGKFALSVGTILFIYWGFLKEKDIECYCGANERESRRKPNKMQNDQDKLQSRCTCRRRRGTTYACGCKRNIKKNFTGGNDEADLPNSEDAEDDKICNCTRK